MNKRCPVCHSPLLSTERQLLCPKGHSFDRAAAGYTNLLLPTKGKSKNHGDTKEMVVARSNFLRQGYYEPLSDAINKAFSSQIKGKKIGVVDAGCGEGYYTERLLEHLKEKDITAEIQGYDVSKQAILAAAKRNKHIEYGVASLFSLPVMDEQCEGVLNLFAPMCPEEFSRVLKKEGVLIIVAPREEHLWGLKEVLYDLPYKNQLSEKNIPHFTLVNEVNVTYTILVEGEENIQSLFSMTPYFWKTSLKDKAKLTDLQKLETILDFAILVYRKNS